MTLHLFPLAEVKGRLVQATSGISFPNEIELRISWPPGKVGDREPPAIREEIVCPVSAAGVLICGIPRTELDLQLRAPPFAPWYRWGARVPENGPLELGNLFLVEGASLSGWVEAEGAIGESSAIEVRLAPAAQGLTAGVQALEGRARKGTAEGSGFFQLLGLEPGPYVLEASLKGFGGASLPAVILHAGEETVLRDPLVLQRPAHLEVTLSPATDAYGRPWILRLLREQPHARFMETLAQGSPGPDGTWYGGPFETGDVSLEIGDSEGSVWLEETLTLLPASNSRFLEVPLVPVEGSVRVGDEAVQGRLWFGGRRRVPNVVVELDEEGRFSGYLPREGIWALDLEGAEESLEQAIDPVVVQIPEGKSVAELELRLPDTELRGRVMGLDGEAVGRALVVLLGLREGQEKRREALARTNAEGEFRIRGVPPGQLALRAHKGKDDSGWREVRITEGFDHPEVVLLLEELLTVAGRITHGGSGVAGAAVLAVSSSGTSQRTAVTGPDGSFSLDLRDEPASLAVSALGRGFALQSLSPRAASSRLLEIDLGSAGGVLVLDVSGSFAADSELAGLRLIRGGGARGASIPFLALLRDLRLPVGELLSRLEVDGAEPGDWALCDSSGHCVSGYLPPGGLLILGEDPPG